LHLTKNVPGDGTILIWRKAEWAEIGVIAAMATFVSRCPNTALNVQGFVADDSDDDVFVPIACIACRRTHMVKPANRKVLGATDAKEAR
jgi:hypothetical protein